MREGNEVDKVSKSERATPASGQNQLEWLEGANYASLKFICIWYCTYSLQGAKEGGVSILALFGDYSLAKKQELSNTIVF